MKYETKNYKLNFCSAHRVAAEASKLQNGAKKVVKLMIVAPHPASIRLPKPSYSTVHILCSTGP